MGSSASVHEKDKVILHQFGRGWKAPSLSPFILKLETYLRMGKIPYENVHSTKKSPKGKFPWIEYNGETLGDTQFIINYLNKKRDINFNSHLTEEQQSIARAIQMMVEEHLYWTCVLGRWHFDKEKVMMKKQFSGAARIALPIIKRGLMKQTYAQGIGRHSYEEVMGIMEGDMKALSDYLGTNQFIMGDQPCETDCCVFGTLSQFRWQMEGSLGERIVTEKYPNLAAYCDRMKDKYWPDWDDCTTRSFTAKAKD